jgi:hypothetical protein
MAPNKILLKTLLRAFNRRTQQPLAFLDAATHLMSNPFWFTMVQPRREELAQDGEEGAAGVDLEWEMSKMILYLMVMVDLLKSMF